MSTLRNTLGILGLCGLMAVGCQPKGTGPGSSATGSGKKPVFAYVTNGIADFWIVAQKGVEKAGRDLDVGVEVIMPPNGVDDQKRMVQNALTKGIDGVAISPIDPDNQTDLLDEIAANTLLITHDSDAPKSKRQVYIGMDNYAAGRMCGQVIKEALPDGGSVMLFVGRLGQLNAKLRRQGVIDELLGRDNDPNRYDEPGKVLKGADGKYEVLDTRTDDFDFAKAKSQAQDAITKYPNLGCMVGLFAYNPPKLIEAVREANKVGQIKIVGFDEDNETLQGVTDGVVHGTVVQNPYEYGYQSIKMLKQLHAGDRSGIPEGGFIDIPARKITKGNVGEFWANLKQLTGDGAKAAPAGEGKATDAK